MISIAVSATTLRPSHGSGYRLTAKGRACVAVVETGGQTVGSLSRYLHDLLMLCGSGAWFEQLRQFIPPRSLEDALKALQTLDLIEPFDVISLY